ncbi:flagellar hook-associated protein 3 FlgL [Texcoconibacillus texcoconensis]|uniref:Flagellar hook-associated protein 3 FlgL n=2 Tax=Texcoconibacillus texcoconensis TaxID=1095777 RepID=A0A840QR08_9BACI|nr:flagellar hook-associated protein 3 FlgL [Texcoconibacillus texcoconensis]
MNGMRYRTEVAEAGQFKRNVSEVYNWMDNSDDALDEATNAMHRVRELGVQAANDSYEEGQRANIAKEVRQLREHLQSVANTQANGKYIFNGADTTTAPVDESLLDVGLDADGFQNQLEEMADEERDAGDFRYNITYDGGKYEMVEQNGDNEFTFARTDLPDGKQKELIFNKEEGTVTYEHTYLDEEGEEVTDREELPARQVVVSHEDAVSNNDTNVEIELLKGVNMPVNVDATNVFSSDFFGDIKRLENILEDENAETSEISAVLDNLDGQIDKIVDERAELGARYNRVEMMDERVQDQEIIAKRIMSDNEDADIAEVITNLQEQENVHRAALSSSSRIIQPTLMDFLN